ncbi:hypothetical protein AQB9606_03073 [Aquabacterium sp. CECT 9606]|nr:hypothetical protein AQB9606_03073 [Aquabacterium sp. CECT 9606]
MSVPVTLSPGRGGFGPQLALSYDSGSGQGTFGLGWSLALPSISRKTEKGLPRYLDADESDVFLLSGAEDLVPLLDDAGNRVVDAAVQLAGQWYRIHRYRPRIEGLFARIERWVVDGESKTSFWRTISRDNITTWYGKDDGSQVVDPADPSRVYQWLICQTHDDKGNVAVYQYILEDARNVDTRTVWETNRQDAARQSNRYLKRILYGNVEPYLPKLDSLAVDALPQTWMFEAVFDYGDHQGRAEDGRFPTPQPDTDWASRDDAFSSHRAGFEVRTYRLCQRVLMFHNFPKAQEVGQGCLVRSTDFEYDKPDALLDALHTGYATLRRVRQRSYKKVVPAAMPKYKWRELPPVQFDYSQPVVSQVVHIIDPVQLENLPVGVQGPGYRWIDLDGEGLSGVLAEQAGGWFYKANLGDGQFGAMRQVARTPAMAVADGSRTQFMDLSGNGQIDLVEFDGATPGFHERDRDDGWKRHVPFANLPNIDWQDPNLRFVDLTGDGHADALITEQEVFTWYPSLDERGFSAAQQTRLAPDENAGASIVFADGTQTIFLADMCGDGLTDLVRIRNGEVCYWPNLGYGRFGRKVTLGNSPRFDHVDLFDPRRIRLTDIDGSGPIDIIYLGREGAKLYFNRSGNSLSNPLTVNLPVATENLGAVQVVDLFGNGTACLVWNSHLPADASHPVCYIDLMGGMLESIERHRQHEKPHLLIKVDNNLGATTDIEYTPSTRFYLQDQQAGQPWITRLPFPVHCVSKVTARDKWRGTAFSSTYSYHHGYFDGTEREFRGFGRVEQLDVEDFGTFAAGNVGSPWITKDQTLYQPPVKTITWYHTGAALERQRILSQFEHEYFPQRFAARLPQGPGAFREKRLPEPELSSDLSADEWREALRACKGMVLRLEAYELDLGDLVAMPSKHTPVRLYSSATHNCHIQRLQARGTNLHSVFLVTESEALTYHYELPLPKDQSALKPDPRVAHTLNLSHDDLGNPQQSIAVGYGRVQPVIYPGLPRAELIAQLQAELHVAYSESHYTQDIVTPARAGDASPIRHHRLRLPFEVLGYELNGIARSDADYFSLADFRKLHLSDVYGPQPSHLPPPIAVAFKQYHEVADGAVPQRRIVEHARSAYFDDASDEKPLDNKKPLPFGKHGPRGLKFEDYKLALTADLLSAVFRQADAAGPLSDKLAWEALPAEGNRPARTALDLLDDITVSGYWPGSEIGMHSSEYWMRSGTAGFASDAHRHFYLPESYTDPFKNETTLQYDPLDLFVAASADALGNTSKVVGFDYRVLAPREVQDVNGNLSEVAFNVLGLPAAAAVKGKGDEGDNLASLDEHLEPSLAERIAFFTQDFSMPVARGLLQDASIRHVHHFGETLAPDGSVRYGQHPPCAATIQREKHVASLERGQKSPLQIAFEYSDGSGNLLLKKVRAEARPTSSTDPQPAEQVIDDFSTGPFASSYLISSSDLPVNASDRAGATSSEVLTGIQMEGVSATTSELVGEPGRIANLLGEVDSDKLLRGGRIDVVQSQAGSMVGGERFLGMSLWGDAGKAASLDIASASNAFAFSSDVGAYHRFDWSYGTTYIRYTPISLDLGNYNALRFRFLSAPRGLNFNVLLYFRGQANNYAQLSLNIGPHADPFDVDFSFDSFRTKIADPTRPADFSLLSGIYIVTQSGGYVGDGGEGFGIGAISAVSLPRWVVNGKTILNNKGKPVKQYEPYFTDSHWFEEPVETGVSPVMYYDAAGRVVRTEFPDGTLSRVEFSPWHAKTWDQNDTVLESAWYKARNQFDPASPLPVPLPGLSPVDHEQRACWLTARHAETPSLTLLDSLGRDVIAVAHNRVEDETGPHKFGGKQWTDDYYLTYTKLDAEGKPLWIRDARDNLVMQYILPNKPTRLADQDNEDIPSRPVGGATVYSAPTYDMAGNLLYQHSMDAGDRWMLMDAAGKPMLAWDFNDRGPDTAIQARLYRTDYDPLHRPTAQWLKIDADAPAMVEAFDYCDAASPRDAAGPISLADAQQRNLIGQSVSHFDPSGLATVERVSLLGQPTHVTRRLILPHSDGDDGLLNWHTAARNELLEQETFRHITEFDALGRMTRLYNWHRDITFAPDGTFQDTPGQTNRVAVYEPNYNERGALQSEWLHVRASKTTRADGAVTFEPDPTRSAQAIEHIEYNAKGQKLSLNLGNGAQTRYSYDERNFRLTHLYTRRSAAKFPDDCISNTASQPRPQRPCGVQNLCYCYDPVGNITHIQDDAQDAVFFKGQFVEPSNDYTYDALYRLTEATGREHDEQEPPPLREGPWRPGNFPSGDQLRNYTQRYLYDPVSNFVEMAHEAGAGSWTRHYRTQADNNRLHQTWLGNNTEDALTLQHDSRGSMLNLNRRDTDAPPPIREDERWGRQIQWDWRDMIRGFDMGGGGLARYHYGIDKQRTRKHITRNPQNGGTLKEDRIYLGGYELYRRRNAQNVVVEEIESLHLFEGEQQVLLVDDVISADNSRPDGLSISAKTLFRYQYSNHLGTVGLELDTEGQIISYEEFHSYGTSAYRLMDRAKEAPPKRYRYTGMGRDEESGLSYHTARYYSPWLGRWVSFDPDIGNLPVSPYTFCASTPICKTDKYGMAPDDPILTRSDLVLTNEHTLPKSKFPNEAVNPFNLTTYTARENSFKGVKSVSPRPPVEPISLKNAKLNGKQAFSKAGQKMLQASHGDTNELKAIWDKASTSKSGGGKVGYDTAATKFNKLHLTDKSPEMSLLKEVYAEANIVIDPKTGERSIDMKPSNRALMWDDALKGKTQPPANLSPRVADAFNRLKAEGVATATATATASAPSPLSRFLTKALGLANSGAKTLITVARTVGVLSALPGAIAAADQYGNATTSRDVFDPDESPGMKKAGVFALTLGAGWLDNSIAVERALITGLADQGGFVIIDQSYSSNGMSPTQHSVKQWALKP